MIRTALKNSNETFCEITSKRINGTIAKSFELYGWIQDLLLEIVDYLHAKFDVNQTEIKSQKDMITFFAYKD